MSLEHPTENFSPANDANNEELPKAPEESIDLSDPVNTERGQETSIEEEIREMSDVQLLEYLEQITLDFSAAILHHESLRDVVGGETEYVRALVAAKRLQKEKGAINKEAIRRGLEIITPEYIPQPEEVLKVFARLTTKETKEVRRNEDGNGLCLLEVRVDGDNEGEFTEYTYRRAGYGGTTWTNEIDVTHYDGDIPFTGGLAARYIDGDWEILDRPEWQS